MALLSTIRGLQERLADHPDAVVGAAMSHLKQIAEIIQRDVMVRGHRPTLRPLE